MSQTRSPIDDPLNAFCTDTEAYLVGADSGPLAGLRFAAKDIFDVAGHVSGCGNPDWKRTHEPAERTAWAVQVLVDAGATMVGKTHTDELTRGIFGLNAHYGTPTNPRAPGRVPGGSSSGSAVAVAGGLVDFALGSDTGGSVRAPASFCGLYGLRPTHGRISMAGALNGSATYDTAGYLTADAEMFARVGEVLLQSSIVPARPNRLVVVEDGFEVADAEAVAALRPRVDEIAGLVGEVGSLRLSSGGLPKWVQQISILAGRESLESVRDWIERVDPRFGYEVALRYTSADAFTAEEVEAAQRTREQVRARVNEVLDAGTVLCMPTTGIPAPPVGQTLNQRKALRQRILSLTCVAGTAGTPQINLPLAEVDGLPVGLSLLGARGEDELLIGFALEIAREFDPEFEGRRP